MGEGRDQVMVRIGGGGGSELEVAEGRLGSEIHVTSLDRIQCCCSGWQVSLVDPKVNLTL